MGSLQVSLNKTKLFIGSLMHTVLNFLVCLVEAAVEMIIELLVGTHALPVGELAQLRLRLAFFSELGGNV